MEGGIVTADQGLKRGEILGRVVGGHVTIQSLFKRAIESFHHTGFGISRRGKMTNAMLFQEVAHVFIIKFFPVIRLQCVRFPSALLQHVFQGGCHFHPRLFLDGTDPGIFGKHVDDGQQVMHAFILSLDILYVHQIRRPLLVGTVDFDA